MRLRICFLLAVAAISGCATPEPKISDRDQMAAGQNFGMCAVDAFPELASMTISVDDLANAAFVKCSEEERYYRAVTLAWMKQNTPPELQTKEFMLPRLEQRTLGLKQVIKENLAEMLDEARKQIHAEGHVYP